MTVLVPVLRLTGARPVGGIFQPDIWLRLDSSYTIHLVLVEIRSVRRRAANTEGALVVPASFCGAHQINLMHEAISGLIRYMAGSL